MGLFTIHIRDDRETKKLLYSIIKKLDNIMANQTQLAAELVALKDQNEKAHAEHLAKLADLEAAIVAAGNTTPEVDAALTALKASIQKDDDLTPDA